MPQPQLIANCLDTAGSLARVLEHARLLQRAQAIHESVAPGALAAASRVANIKAGVVVIHAENSAVAAKLRQFAGRLTNEFFKRGIQCTGIDVLVQPPRPPVEYPPGVPRTLSAQAVAHLSQLSDRLPPGSPMRQALEKLFKPAGE